MCLKDVHAQNSQTQCGHLAQQVDVHEFPALFDAIEEIVIGEAAKARLKDCSSQKSASTMWAFATAGHASP
eukprot:2414981-Karenia_brevis.AAC.1